MDRTMEPSHHRATRVGIAVVAVALLLRMWNLGQPAQTVFDESWYTFDAVAFLGGGAFRPPEPWVAIKDDSTPDHPPLGKWLIAAGTGPYSKPIGWRFPSMVFGVAGVLLVYLLALTLWRSPWWAGLAGLLVALDGVHIVQSRLAMLDIFMSTFVLGGVLCAVLEYQRRAGIPVPTVTRNRVFGSRYLLGSGVLLGAAVATKWTGLFIVGPVIVLGLVSLAAPAPDEDGSTRQRALNVAVSLLVAPVAVYVASYAMFFVQHGPAVGEFVSLQAAMLHHQWIHSHVQVENSAPISWPLLAHPIRYAWDQAATREVVLVGNPLLWWGFLAALPLLVYRVARYRSWQEMVVLGGYVLLYGPWLVIPRTQFLFYMVPAVPFMALGLVAVLRSLPSPGARRLGVGTGVAAVLAAAAYAPVWLYLSVPVGWLRFLPLIPSH
jgi:dolichyl-phosphate-mannose-protein mannosyltransferase